MLNRNEALLARDLANKRLGVGRFPGPRGSRDQDILAAANSQAHEGFVLLCLKQLDQLDFRRVERVCGAASRAKEASPREFLKRPYFIRGTSDRERDAPLRRRRRQHDLNALAAREGGGEKR